MIHTNFYNKYKEIEAQEREELKKAVMAHGGEFCFETKDGGSIEGVQPPVVLAGDSHWESNCDCTITRVAVVDNYLEIYGYDKSVGGPEMRLDDIELGHISFIIDEIPGTSEVSDVTSEIDEVPVISLYRQDIETAGFSPEITNYQLEQIASQVCKYLEWQGFFSQYLDDIREACRCCGISPLDNEDDEK